MNGGGFNAGRMPKSLTCWICGKGFGTASLKFHIKSCQQKWEIEQEKRPKNQRRPCPQPPRGLMDLMEKGGNVTHADIQKANQQAFDQYDKESLYPCQNCGRTFGYDQLQRHKKVCTADRPMNKLNRAEPPARAGGEMGQRPAMARAAPARTGMGGGGGYGGPSPADSMPIGGGGKKASSYAYDQMDDAYDDGGAVNTAPCRKCGRNFAEDRLAKHEKICKVNAKPKKVKMFHKPITDKEKAKMDAVKAKTSKWREQHNDFVQAMKYNRKMAQVEAKGGDIRMMAPPPSSSQVGLVPCPHCGRKFGEVQAAKHIPACKNTVNKPKPPPTKAGGGMGSMGGRGAAYGYGESKVSSGPTRSSGLGGGVSGQSYGRAAPGGPSGRTQGGMGGMGGMGGAPGQNGNYRRKF